MKAVFADTFYWIALTQDSDSFYRQARSVDAPAIVTTHEVLTEYLNYFAERDNRLRFAALENVANIRRNPNVRVIPQSAESFEAGLELYRARPDKGYSLTDCISMTTMTRAGLTDALTNDRHFEQEGFRALFRVSETT